MAKILVVDDDPVMRSVLAKAITPLSHDIHFASDGIHALDALRCNPGFDLLITDISMPTMGGRQLIDTVVRDKALPDIPILITSGVVRLSEIADLLELGATKFVAKPINMDLFRQDVADVLVHEPALSR